MYKLDNIDDVDSTVDSTDMLTKEMLIDTLPDKRFRRHVTDEILELINSETDSDLRRVFRDNALTYTSVLMQGRHSLSAYVNAVKFASHRLMGDINSMAYKKVFVDRYAAMVAKGYTSSYIASFANNNANNPLVVNILERAVVPTHILNAGIYQEAINTQAELMRTANSEMVRQKAAESLLINLKAPESTKIELDVSYGQSGMIEDLRATTKALAQQQVKLIKEGVSSAKDIAHSEIIANKVETEYVELPSKSA